MAALFKKCYTNLNNPKFHINLVEKMPILTLFPPNGLSGKSDVIEILNTFYIEFVSNKRLADNQKQLVKVLKKKLKRVNSNLNKRKIRLKQINTNRSIRK